MINIIFTLDYEIRGNGTGSPNSLMVKPTERLINLFNKYGAKLTIMADVAQILKYNEYYDHHQVDHFYFLKILNQLKTAILAKHDVQLHIHSSFLNSKYQNNKWNQNWDDYNLASLDYDRINCIIKKCKVFLENILKPVNQKYRCFIFRASNWSMLPSNNIIAALEANKIEIDTSVFKYGSRKGIVNFDYSDAYSNILPWSVDKNDIRLKDAQSRFFEYPIYCEKQKLKRFISLNRILNYIDTSTHKIKHIQPISSEKSDQSLNLKMKFKELYNRFFIKEYPLKMDFNLCTGKQLIKQLIKIENQYKDHHSDVPLVLIGHSKSFNYLNQIELEKFLKYVSKRSSQYSFALFKDVHNN